MLEQVRKTITRYNMLSKGSRIAVAVSGGADSVCLLYVLRELAGEYGIELSVAHFNHQLRGAESDEDERAVAGIAARLRLRFYRAGLKVAAIPGNLEQVARRARQAFFADLRANHGIDRVALGHTRDDQAETVMFRLLRGAGLAGLAGIRPVTASGLVRPLIDITRAEVEDFLRSRGIAWREDASNQDLHFARNRIRHGLLPQLARDWNPSLRQSLANMADLAGEEENWWSDYVEGMAGRYLQCGNGFVEFAIPAVASLPLGLRRRLLRFAVSRVKGDLRGLDYAHFAAILDLMERVEGHGSMRLPGGIAVRRSFEWVRIEHAGSGFAGLPSTPLTVPGIYRIPGGTAIQVEVVAAPPPQPKNVTLRAAELSFDCVPAKLELRGWKTGDQYWPEGQDRRRKVKEMFQMARIPSWRRASWPIVSHGTQIVWAREFGPAREFAAGSKGGKRLRIWEIDPGNVPGGTK